MHVMRSTRRRPWLIMLDVEGQKQMIDVASQSVPFTGTEREKDIFVEQLILQAKSQALPLKSVDVFPLAWNEINGIKKF